MPTPKTVLITGGASGIGLTLAQHHIAQGDHVIVVARRSQPDVLNVETVLYCRLDLADTGPLTQLNNFLDQHAIAQLNLVIHNAAQGDYGQLGHQSQAEVDRIMAVNMIAPAMLTQQLYPYVQRAHGKIVFVSSLAAQMACPDYAIYAASKAGLNAFARSLQRELEGEVQVQALILGAVNSGMHAKLGIPKTDMDWQRFPAVATAVRQIVRACQTRHKRVVPNWQHIIIDRLSRYCPQLINRRRARHPVELPSQLADRKRCLITGAAQGLGHALAQHYHAQGYQVVALDREVATLSTEYEVVQCDLAQPEFDVSMLGQQPFDVVIHNAGISCVGPFVTSDWSQQANVLRVNAIAPMQMTLALLRAGLLHQRSSIVGIASLATFVGYPGAAVYAASKAVLASFLTSARQALGVDNHAMLVYPGPLQTAHAKKYSPNNDRHHRRQSPEQLAEQIYRAQQRRQAVLIPGLANHVSARLGQFCPGLLDGLMKRYLYRDIVSKQFTAS